jgi:hypothetical protein
MQVQRHMSDIESHLIYEAHGKIAAQKMINPTAQEVSYDGVGRFTNGVDVTEVWTYVNSHTPNGAIQGVGDGMLKTVDNKEIANAKGYGRGLTEAGKIVYRTAQLYSTDSNDRLAFLKDVVGFSEWQVDDSGNYSYKMWQFK